MGRDNDDEIDNLRDQIAQMQRDYEAFGIEKDLQISELEGNYEKKLEDKDAEWSEKNQILEDSFKEQFQMLSKELEKLRNAFSGDSSGWVTKKNKKGIEFYENVETGETQVDMPEVIYISRAMLRVEEADKTLAEVESLRVRCREAELKKREADIVITKVKTEVNALRNLEKGWKACASEVFTFSRDITNQIVADTIVLEERVDKLNKSSVSLNKKTPKIRKITELVKQLQLTNAEQAKAIAQLDSQNFKLNRELETTKKRLDYIMKNIEEEVEKQVKPMRDQVADTITILMKEKSERAQERRHVADLWPAGHLMPTMLMKSRPLSEEEINQRKHISELQEAQKALTLEIRANVAQSTKWSVKYDDYGRIYYEHADTGESSWEPPEIMSYEPPPGYDPMGNLITPAEKLDPHWKLKSDSRGQVYYYHEVTQESTYIPPTAYRKIPPAKTPEAIVGEAAQLVLAYIKRKIKDDLENSTILTNSQSQDLESVESSSKNNSRVNSQFSKLKRSSLTSSNNADESQQLQSVDHDEPDFMTDKESARFLYDIETVEMLASSVSSDVKEYGVYASIYNDISLSASSYNNGGSLDNSYTSNTVLDNSGEGGESYSDTAQQTEAMKEEAMFGPSLAYVDLDNTDNDQLRNYIEHLAVMEAKLECRIQKTRANMKDFSFVLLERIRDEEFDEKEDMKDLYGNQPVNFGKGTNLGRRMSAFVVNNSTKATAVTTAVVPTDSEDKAIAKDLVLGDVAVFGTSSHTANTQAAKVGADLDLIAITDDLVNLALYCGYSNVRIETSGVDATLETNLYANQNKDDSASDDSWLTKSYFICASSHYVDAIRENTSRPLHKGVTDVQRDIATSTLSLLHIADDLDDSSDVMEEDDLHNVKVSSMLLSRKHSLWQGRVLVSEVIRFQLQQEAVSINLTHRNNTKNRRRSALKMTTAIVSELVDLSVHQIRAEGLPEQKRIPLEPRYVRISLGSWTIRTDEEVSSDNGNIDMIWDHVNVTVSLPIAKIQTGELLVEVFQKSDIRADTLIGSSWIRISNVLGENVGKDIEMEVRLKDRRDKYCGKLILVMCADSEHIQSVKTKDPNNLNDLVKPLAVKAIYTRSSGLISGEEATALITLVEQQSSFASLVSDLRGDGITPVQLLIGDVHLEDILRLGHQPNQSSIKKLPSFKSAKKYLSAKQSMHFLQVEKLSEELESFEDIENKLKGGSNAAQGTLDICAYIFQDLKDRDTTLRKNAKKVQDRMEKLRTPIPKPPEPAFKPFEEIKYVPEATRPASEDEQGKKKVGMSSADVKALVEAVTSGDMDGGEWDFGAFSLSSSQMSQIKRAVNSRNMLLDQERNAEKLMREKTLVEFTAKVSDWETDERRRKAAFELTKKESRKVHLLLSCVQERADFIEGQMKTLEEDMQSWSDATKQHQEATGRFAVNRAKLTIERRRIKGAIMNLKSKLTSILAARRSALVYPGNAKNDIQFHRMKERAEIALRTLRYEVVDIKSKLQMEGARLRQLMVEEDSILRGEVCRLKVLREGMRQRQAIDNILERHKTEVIYLMEDLEKLKLVEAEHDDRGLSYTVDDAGEEYIPDKAWENPVINTTTKTIELLRGKIALTDKLRETAVSSQLYLLEAVSVKWGPDFLSVRDSWVENSDFERAENLRAELSLWIHSQRDKLAVNEHDVNNVKVEAGLEVDAVRARHAMNLHCHEEETTAITNSAIDAINIVNKRLDDLKISSSARFSLLENSITELSKELHEIREERLKQTLEFENKVKTLMAFILTLQSTLEHLYISLNVLREQNKAISLKASLESERLRYQYRAERCHSANLSFIILMQRSTIKLLQQKVVALHDQMNQAEINHREEKRQFRREIWEHIFAFSRLSIDVDSLFEFFALRLANLAGSRAAVNDLIRENGGALILSALCQSPRQSVRKSAARALAGMGWNGFVEHRIIMWDCVMYWRTFKSSVMLADNSKFDSVKRKFMDTGNYEVVLELEDELEPYTPPIGMSMRSVVRQRRQYALRATRRKEGPNAENQKLLNMKNGVIPSLLDLCDKDGDIDWEIVRNASLALSVASYAEQNRLDMAADGRCIKLLVSMCAKEDPEIRTHAGVAVANLVHHNEKAQKIFGEQGVIPAMLQMCTVPVPDVLEAATAALANLTSFCDENCRIVLEESGVACVAKLLTLSFSENLLDLDQNDEVQANAAEFLTNVSRYNCELTVNQFSSDVIDSLIISCNSNNVQVKRHIPLVLGNIAQNAFCRQDIGDRGGVECLFLVLEDEDQSTRANVLWALANLMWHTPNQTRAGRFLNEILALMKDDFLPIKTHAAVLLANVLYFCSQNRIRFLETEGAMELLVDELNKRQDCSIIEACLRAMLSLSYLDTSALWLGDPSEGDCIPLFVSYLVPPYFTVDCMKYAVEILLNLCVHHDNRRIILESQGIEALVYLLGEEDPLVRECVLQILVHLEDVTPPEVLARMKTTIGLERMVKLTTNADPLVRAVAAESIGEEVWKNPAKQRDACENGGVSALLAVCATKGERLESLLPALWSLRNVLHRNEEAQNLFAIDDGIQVLLSVIKKVFFGKYEEQSDKVLEAVLICILTAIENHERNSRRLLKLGLECMIDIADKKPSGLDFEDVDTCVQRALCSEGNVAMAKTVLQLLGPYNYVVCKNCQKKQDLNGTHCINCGYTLLTEAQVDLLPVNSSTPINTNKKSTIHTNSIASQSPVPKMLSNKTNGSMTKKYHLEPMRNTK